MPVAHALIQVKEDLEALVPRVPDNLVWELPGGAASIGFHVRHIAGATDRLLNLCARGVTQPRQLAAARAEATGSESMRVIVDEAHAALDRALQQVRDTPRDVLLVDRKVESWPAVEHALCFLMHAAEHATRHAGQAITTAIVVGARARH